MARKPNFPKFRTPGAVASKPAQGQGLLGAIQTPINPMPMAMSVKPPLGAMPSVGGGPGAPSQIKRPKMMRMPGAPRGRNTR
jgi:hypothetical protein